MYRKWRRRSYGAITYFFLFSCGAYAQSSCDISATTTGGTLDRLSAMQACIAHQSTLIEQLLDRQRASETTTGVVAVHSDTSHEGQVNHTHPYSPDAHSHDDLLPPGAVIFSTVRCEDFGWKKLEGSFGRFPIGAGAVGTVQQDKYALFDALDDEGNLVKVRLRPYQGRPYGALDTGGAETVTLTQGEMPRHKHTIDDPTHAHLDRHLGDRNGSTNGYTAVGDGNLSLVLPTSKSPTGIEVLETGSSQSHNNMPPYIALYFCKKD